MGSDAAAAAAKASPPAAGKDVVGKKKKANRSAKLKQCKLDARREQWLSQVKNRSCKVVKMHTSPSSTCPVPLSLPRTGKPNAPVGGGNHSQRRPRREEDRQNIVMDAQGNSMSRSVSGTGTGGKDCVASSVGRGSYLRAARIADEFDGNGVIKGEGRGGGSLDDWEAVADALTTRADGCYPKTCKRAAAVPDSARSVIPHNADGILGKPESDRRIPRAWTLDDVSRPRSLPKQHNISPDSQWYCSQGTVNWTHHVVASPPSLCPICYEDLDVTDSSFLPCSCGFRLCLFCHKRILEDDGRCPGCRKEYSPLKDGEARVSSGGMVLLPLQMSRS